jgi:hypothetical protein
MYKMHIFAHCEGEFFAEIIRIFGMVENDRSVTKVAFQERADPVVSPAHFSGAEAKRRFAQQRMIEISLNRGLPGLFTNDPA